ncbi:hypothetical protein P3C58_22655 [Mesorhizobium sp. XAP10]|uniref:hypothetical protein n=1 Tax=unclassified Mesorhizobium TaxID=325217 RepID=UPI0023DEC0EE|nr:MULTISPECIES: hypothetical protein [unclassified Mesorhizobium]MDF3154784.1 hypothetical protein [Mesorhizobium sp. XAP10]MDF3247666.1 hypothetical protein [Mesorhizobium sp. XAP4]
MTKEFRSLEVTAFWIASSELRKAIRSGGANVEALTQAVENHARYGVQPAIKARAKELLGERRRSRKAG